MAGEFTKVNGIDLLVLDEINGNPFVIALDVDEESKFDSESNDYRNSDLKNRIDQWFRNTGIKAIEREVDLTAMDGYKGYGVMRTKCAPLTFDEYRKYASIIKPHIKNWFWTVTPWGDPNDDTWASKSVCFVYYSGTANNNYYWGSRGLAPAFILDKSSISVFDKPFGTLSEYTIQELLEEISRRL